VEEWGGGVFFSAGQSCWVKTVAILLDSWWFPVPMKRDNGLNFSWMRRGNDI
jgi:hypothetical protein